MYISVNQYIMFNSIVICICNTKNSFTFAVNKSKTKWNTIKVFFLICRLTVYCWVMTDRNSAYS